MLFDEDVTNGGGGGDPAPDPEKKEPDPGPVVDPNYDPRTDPGPERYEDKNIPESIWGEDPIPLESQRRDDTTLLATDKVSVDAENNLVIEPVEEAA